MPGPRLSIIMPVYNGRLHVQRAIESVRRQTWLDWELIVVDDGSTDGSRDLVQQLVAQEPRLRLIRRPHEGIVSALNIGLAEARAPFIGRMDADDESYPTRFGVQMLLLERDPEIGLAGCKVDFGGDRVQAEGYALHVDWINSLATPEDICIQRFVESPFAHPSVVFRRELVERYGGYREGDFPEDYELWLRWLDAEVRMLKAPEVLLRWNDAPDRLSRQDPRYQAEAFYRCKAVYLARWLHQRVESGRPLLVWGAGRPTRRRADHLLEHGIRIAGYIDIDPSKIGRTLLGRKVLSPDHIPDPSECFVLGYVAKRGARDLARSHLHTRGFIEGRDFIMAA